MSRPPSRSAAWRATVLDHQRGRYAPSERPAGPLARREGLRIHGRTREIRCTDAEGTTLWTSPCAGVPNAAHLSGDRVLVTTDSLDYTPWGHLGPALLLDLADGALVTELRGARGAALPGGDFLLGLEGYDFFDTWRHDRDGNRVDAWRSYGHYVVGTGIRVVEADRSVPTEGRVVRLLPGGVVERGPRLRDPQPPKPLVLADGTVLVLDAGVLRAFGRGLEDTVLAKLLPHSADQAHRYAGELRRTGERRITALLTEIRPPAGGSGSPAEPVLHTWSIELHRRG